MKDLTAEEQRIADAALQIAVFEGYKVYYGHGYGNVIYSDDNDRCLIDTGYHDELRWLKPVIRLIKKKGYKCTLIGRYCTITGLPDGLKFKSPDKPNNEVESVWLPVLEFCTWYNQQDPENKQKLEDFKKECED